MHARTAQGGPDSFWPCVAAMVKCIAGAGMTALPSALYRLGWPAGVSLLLAVAALNYFSQQILVHGSECTGAGTYARLSHATGGRALAAATRISVFLFCFGFATVYLCAMGDILAGTPGNCDGLICELTRQMLDPPRGVVITAVALLLAPFTAQRSMGGLAAFNAIGVAAVVALVAAVVGVAATAVVRGLASPLPTAPQWDQFGQDGPSIARGILGVVPVVLSCYVSHQAVHPLMPLLRPYSPARMRGVLATAMAACAALFCLLALCGALAFGSGTAVNVLSNLSLASLQPLVGATAAQLLSVLVRCGFLLSLAGSLLLYMFPLRSSCADWVLWCAQPRPAGERSLAAVAAQDAERGPLLAGEGSSEPLSGPASPRSTPPPAPEGEAAEQLPVPLFLGLTAALLAAVLACAVLVPNIWELLTLIGGLAGTVQAFIVPGSIALLLLARPQAGRVGAVATACQAGLAVVLTLIGVGLLGLLFV